MITRFLIAVALATIPVSDSADQHNDVITWLQRAECRGVFSDTIMNGTNWEREKVALFLELRRRGSIPPYSVEWCIKQGIVPVQRTKRQGT